MLLGDEEFYSYHEQERIDLRGDSLLAVGLEIEKNNVDEDVGDIDTRHLYYNTDWIVEADSSVLFELVSPILPFDNLEKLAEKIEQHPELIDIINSDDINNRQAGGHINISHRSYSPKSLFAIYGALVPLLYILYPARSDNPYSKQQFFVDIYNGNVDTKASAVVIKDDRVEFRIFPKVKNYKQLKWRLELLHLLFFKLEKELRKELEIENKNWEVLAYDDLAEFVRSVGVKTVKKMLNRKNGKLAKHLLKVLPEKRLAEIQKTYERKANDFFS